MAMSGIYGQDLPVEFGLLNAMLLVLPTGGAAE
jgi:hypothetical protein